jgi:hypothetical protein
MRLRLMDKSMYRLDPGWTGKASRKKTVKRIPV